MREGVNEICSEEARTTAWVSATMDGRYLEPCDADPDSATDRDGRDDNAPGLPSPIKALQLASGPDADKAEPTRGPRCVACNMKIFSEMKCMQVALPA